MAGDLDRAAVRGEMEQARQEYHQLLDNATTGSLARPSGGTKWTNQQLLFHMLFGYLVVRALLVLVRVFSRLPDGASRAFAALLDSARRPFHLVNYLGSCAGARIIPPSRMPAMLDKVTAGLARRLDAEPEAALRRGMHYPTTWDPYFSSYMTLADVYRYPTVHFRHHRRQLTLDRTSPAGTAADAAGPVPGDPAAGTPRGAGARAAGPAGSGLARRRPSGSTTGSGGPRTCRRSTKAKRSAN